MARVVLDQADLPRLQNDGHTGCICVVLMAFQGKLGAHMSKIEPGFNEFRVSVSGCCWNAPRTQVTNSSYA
jgi:hypothetical protein